jgi:hypothetical protein
MMKVIQEHDSHDIRVMTYRYEVRTVTTISVSILYCRSRILAIAVIPPCSASETPGEQAEVDDVIEALISFLTINRTTSIDH